MLTSQDTFTSLGEFPISGLAYCLPPITVDSEK